MVEKKKEIFIPGWLIFLGVLITLGFVVLETWFSSAPDVEFSFENYGGTSKVIAFFIAIIAIILTVKRMQQTKVQTDVMIDNVRFNNFFKHREEFITHFSKKKYLQVIAAGAKVKTEKIFMDYYEYFFYKSYSDFRTTLNDDALLNCKGFIANLTSSILNQKLVDLRTLKREDIIWPTPTGGFPLASITNYISNLIKAKHYKFEDHKGVEANVHRFKVFSVVQAYYAYTIIADVLLFSGQQKDVEIERPNGFINNVQGYLDRLNIDIDVISVSS